MFIYRLPHKNNMKLVTAEKPTVLSNRDILRLVNNTRSAGYIINQASFSHVNRELRQNVENTANNIIAQMPPLQDELVEGARRDAVELGVIGRAIREGQAATINRHALAKLVAAKNHWEWKVEEIPKNLLAEWGRCRAYYDKQERNIVEKVLHTLPEYVKAPDWLKIHMEESAVKAVRGIVDSFNHKALGRKTLVGGFAAFVSLGEALIALSTPLETMKEIFRKAPDIAAVIFIGLPLLTIAMAVRYAIAKISSLKLIYSVGNDMEKCIQKAVATQFEEKKDGVRE